MLSRQTWDINNTLTLQYIYKPKKHPLTNEIDSYAVLSDGFERKIVYNKKDERFITFQPLLRYNSTEYGKEYTITRKEDVIEQADGDLLIYQSFKLKQSLQNGQVVAISISEPMLDENGEYFAALTYSYTQDYTSEIEKSNFVYNSTNNNNGCGTNNYNQRTVFANGDIEYKQCGQIVDSF